MRDKLVVVTENSTKNVVVIGASAGGVEPLLTLARALPANFPAALFVVLHVPSHGNSILPQLLARAGSLPAEHANHGEPVRPGRWYVAPPDHHLLIRDGQVHLGRGPSESAHRPAIDPLFRSAASAFDSRVIGVVLSGSLDDGTAGLQAVKQSGGTTIVQDPAEALHPSMPLSALENVEIDHVCRVSELSALLSRLTRNAAQAATASMGAAPKHTSREAAVAEEGQVDMAEQGSPSAFACPDCHGVLWEVREGELVRFRCRVGHAYLPQALSIAQADAVEDSLWVALRALRESAALSERLAERARVRGLTQMAAHYEVRAVEATQRASVIEDVLKRGRLSVGAEDANAADAGQLARSTDAKPK